MNAQALLWSDYARHCQFIMDAALAAVNPYALTKERLEELDWGAGERVFLVALGKAAPAMARAALETLELAGGVVAAPPGATMTTPLERRSRRRLARTVDVGS